MAGKSQKRNILFFLVDALRADKCWGKNKTARTPNINALREKGVTFTQAISVATTTTPCITSIFTGLYPFEHGVRSLEGYKLKSSIHTMAEIFQQEGYCTYAEVSGPLVPEIRLNRGFDVYNLRDKNDTVYSSWGEQLLTKFRNKFFTKPYFIFIHFWTLHRPRHLAQSFDHEEFGKNRYERCLSSLDHFIGRLLPYIDEDTIIIFHSDHGEAILETVTDRLVYNLNIYYTKIKRRLGFENGARLLQVGHGFHVYEYLIRVPLIISGKSLYPERRIVEYQVSQIDILPTLIQTLNLDYPFYNMSGRSLLPLMKGERLPEQPVIMEACGSSLRDKRMWLRGIRTPEFKYVYAPYNKEREAELYDIENDPKEKNNLIESHPGIARLMKNSLKTMLRKSSEKEKINRIISSLRI